MTVALGANCSLFRPRSRTVWYGKELVLLRGNVNPLLYFTGRTNGVEACLVSYATLTSGMRLRLKHNPSSPYHCPPSSRLQALVDSVDKRDI